MKHINTFAALCCLAFAIAASADMVTVRFGTAPSAAATAKAEMPLPSPPVAYVPETTSAPTIDGKGDEEVWKKAGTLNLEKTLNGSSDAAVATAVKVLRDEDFLYALITAEEPMMKKVKASSRNHDGAIYQDDSIEIFIGTSERSYYHFAINSLGSTYDAVGKGGEWNAKTFKAMVQKKADRFTMELRMPLKEMSAGAVPGEWITNFNRNRYASGRLQEFCWSPTYSGESHVPARFGKLMFAEPPAPVAKETLEAGDIASVRLLPVEGGLGVARFNLSSIPKKAKIIRADLLIFRSVQISGSAPEALEDIEIFPVYREFTGSAPKADMKALELRAPWFDRFNVTDTVGRWVNGEANGGFLIKTCPLWNAKATCLDVAYEGEPSGALPEPVKNLSVKHRAGQTFITWQEVDPLIATDKTTWGEIRKALADTSESCRYRIYANDKPITAGNIQEAECLAEVGPLSAYNTIGRNIEYLIGQAMIKPDEMGELAKEYNSFIRRFHMNHPRMDRYPVQRFVVDEEAGMLPAGSGLYVHQADAAGKRYYAVVSVKKGIENTKDFSAGNALKKPVEETTGPGEPVCQGDGLWGPFFDFPGARKNYVQWCAPPFSPRPNMYFNWSVLTPPGLKDGEKATAELYFHPGGRSYAQPGNKLLRNSIQIAPHDYPASAWYGYNDAMGTLKSFKKGVVDNHTQKRINAFLEWAVTTMPIDQDRIIATGGDGAAALAINFPETFAYAYITAFDKMGGVLNGKAAGKYAAIWGPQGPEIKDTQGIANWEWAMLDAMLDRQTKDLSLFICLGPSWGVVKGYARGQGRFYQAMARNNQPLKAGWGWGGGTGQVGATDWYSGRWSGMMIRRDMPVIAISNSSIDIDSEASGHTGGALLNWSDLKDEEDNFSVTLTGRESTFDFTPRRLRHFKVKPNDKISWKAVSLPGGRGEGGGEETTGGVIADKNGTITIPRIKMTGSGFNITLKKMSAEKLDVDRMTIVQDTPACDVTDVVLKLRNWSDKPRKWSAKADSSWIKPAETAGTAKGFEDLVVQLDTKALEPAKAHTGTLTITDADAGTHYPVKITANVGKVFEAPAAYVVNVTAGGASEQVIPLKSLSGVACKIAGTCSLDWIQPGTTGVEAKADGGLPITVNGKGQKPGKYMGVLTVKTDGGSQEVAVTAYVLLEHKESKIPEGETVWLSHKMPEPVKITAHTLSGKSDARTLGKIESTFVDKSTKKKSLLTVEKVTYEHLWYVTPAHETVLNIEGAGFKAFSAEAAMGLDIFNKASAEQFSFEIYVDGELKAATGIVTADQLPRLLVVTGLENAKEIRFVSRRDTDENSRHQMIWGNPRFYK